MPTPGFSTPGPAESLAAFIKKQAMVRGLICYPMPGTRDGRHGDHVFPALPLLMTDDDATLVAQRLISAVPTVLDNPTA